MKKETIKTISILIFCVAFIVTGTLYGFGSANWRQKAKSNEVEKKELIKALNSAKEELNELNNFLIQKNETIETLEKSDEELTRLTRNTWDNLFMGEWKIDSVSYQGRPVPDETAQKMLEEAGDRLVLRCDGFIYRGIDYQKFIYQTFFIKGTEQVSMFLYKKYFKIGGEITEYIYYLNIYGYKNGERIHIGELIMEDENNAHLSLTTPGDASVWLKLERIGDIPGYN